MNLGEVFTELNFLLGKDQYGGNVTPANFQSAINDIVQPEFINSYIRAFEQTREISADIHPFIKTLGDNVNAPLTLVPWSANTDFASAPYPSDYLYFVRSAYPDFKSLTDRKYRSMTWYEQSEWDYITGTDLLFPETTCPAITTQSDQILVCPAVKTARFTYIRTPNDIVFDYDILAGNTIFYLPPGTTHTNSTVLPAGTPSQSVELEWPVGTHPEIVRRLVQYYGRNIGSQLDMSIDNKKPA